MTAKSVSKRWFFRGFVLFIIVVGFTFFALAQLPHFESYRQHQVAHILKAAGVDNERQLVRNGGEPKWTFRLSDGDPFVCEVTLSWGGVDGLRSARWVVIHRIGAKGVALDELAALNDDAHRLTPQLAARESLLGSF